MHSSFLRKQDLKKKNLSSTSDHKDVFLDRPALIFIDYTVFYFHIPSILLGDNGTFIIYHKIMENRKQN